MWRFRVIGRGRRWRRWPVRMCRSRCPRRLSRVRALARVTRATEFMVVHAALAALVSRLAGTDDVVIGTPVAGRGDPETAGMVGMFVNTLVLRTPVDLAADAQTLVQVVRAADTLALDNADIPFEYLVDALAPVRTEAHTPLYQIQLSFQNIWCRAGRRGRRSRRRQPGHRADAGAAHHGSERPELCAGPRRDRWMDGIPALCHRPLRRGVGAAVGAALRGVPRRVRCGAGAAGGRVVADRRCRTRRAGPLVLWRGPRGAECAYPRRDRRAGGRGAGRGGAGVRGPIGDLRRVCRAGGGAGSGVDRAGWAPTSRWRCVPRARWRCWSRCAVVAAGGHYVPVDTETPVERVGSMLDTVDARIVLVVDGDHPVAVTAAQRGAHVLAVDAGPCGGRRD